MLWLKGAHNPLPWWRGIALSEARDSGDGNKWQETSYETDSS